MSRIQNIILAILSILTVILLFNMFLPSTSSQPLTLEVKQVVNEKHTELALNKSSIELLTKVIQDKQDALVVIEKQRTMFLAIIGALAILLAFVGVYGVIQRLVEKSEQEELRNILRDYEHKLKKLDEQIFLARLRNVVQGLGKGQTISSKYGEGHEIVTDLPSYLSFLNRDLLKVHRAYTESNEPSSFIDMILLDLINLTNGYVKYAFKKGYTDNDNCSILDNEVFRNILITLENTLSKKDFETFKNTYTKHFPKTSFRERKKL